MTNPRRCRTLLVLGFGPTLWGCSPANVAPVATAGDIPAYTFSGRLCGRDGCCFADMPVVLTVRWNDGEGCLMVFEELTDDAGGFREIIIPGIPKQRLSAGSLQSGCADYDIYGVAPSELQLSVTVQDVAYDISVPVDTIVLPDFEPYNGNKVDTGRIVLAEIDACQ